MDKPPTDILLLIGGSTVGINAFLRYLLWCDVIVLSCGMTSLWSAVLRYLIRGFKTLYEQ